MKGNSLKCGTILKDKFYNNGYITIYKKVSYNSKSQKYWTGILSKKFDSTEIKQLNNDLKNLVL